MWGSWIVWLVGAAILLSLVMFGLVIGAPIFAIPIVLVGAAVLGIADFRRRRNQTQEVQAFREGAKAESVDFTPRDKETLVSE
jgi:hypothetical protein